MNARSRAPVSGSPFDARGRQTGGRPSPARSGTSPPGSLEIGTKRHCRSHSQSPLTAGRGDANLELAKVKVIFTRLLGLLGPKRLAPGPPKNFPAGQ